MPTGAPDILTLPFRLHTYDLDAGGRLAPAAVARYFQEAASVHATLWGFGAERLAAAGTFWVMHRVAFEFGAMPEWRPNLELTLITWSRGSKRLTAYRDFELCDPTGTRVAAGTSAWIALDIANRRPHRLDVKEDNFPHFPDRHATDAATVEAALPIAVVEDAPLLSRTVGYTDLDINGHVNNTRYLDWTLDALGPGFWRTHRLAAMTMNFLAETRAGDTISVWADPLRQNVIIRNGDRDACRIWVSVADQ